MLKNGNEVREDDGFSMSSHIILTRCLYKPNFQFASKSNIMSLGLRKKKRVPLLPLTVTSRT